jgi:hypothetical protein
VSNLQRTSAAHKINSILLTEFFHTHEQRIDPLNTCLKNQDFYYLEQFIVGRMVGKHTFIFLLAIFQADEKSLTYSRTPCLGNNILKN